jgi:hypothetical protein
MTDSPTQPRTVEHTDRGPLSKHELAALVAADIPHGNLVYRKTARNFGPVMATAATTTIVQVTDVVETGDLDPENVVTPSIFVDRVVHASAESTLAEQPAENGAAG